jgi:hypothetical protein
MEATAVPYHHRSKQAMSMAQNLLMWLPRLIKQGCCAAVKFAIRNYDRSRYGTVKHDHQLWFVPREHAIAALRAVRSGLPIFGVALRIVEEPYTPPAEQPD